MPSEPQRPAPFRFFVFTCRDPRTDFRLPLVDALRRHYETTYIWLRRRPIVSGPNPADPAIEMSLRNFLRYIRGIRSDHTTNIYFNSTNTYFPGLSTVLRVAAAAGVWCLDMHDDLRYHNQGINRWREELIISLLRRLSHVTVHAAPTLQQLFPDSRHLGNASNIRPLPRDRNQGDSVLIIASFDERLDFNFLSELARMTPGIHYHLHGWTRPGDSVTKVQMSAVVAKHDNIHYHGPYEMDDLPAILSEYRVTVAPYRTDTEITQYIDPLRFYHCLNAGVEVVSTDIPQARYMRNYVHVVADPAACADAIASIQSGSLAKQPTYSPITWEQRADRLVEILGTLPRTKKLAASG